MCKFTQIEQQLPDQPVYKKVEVTCEITYNDSIAAFLEIIGRQRVIGAAQPARWEREVRRGTTPTKSTAKAHVTR